MSTTHTRLAASILAVADLLRGDYEESEYGKVILPSTVLRRLDCVLAPTKAAVLACKAELAERGIQNERMLKTVSKVDFYNTSELDFVFAVRDQDYVGCNVRSYIGAFSENAGVRV
ncbi:type I restriction-modification system subunit M N-terminal domain-containing protein [Prauserella muralis]|uniref:Uncharacterized protein n=1 Tax=Prauserella muralis TaxID=588067 RepID=A0A2V4AMZ1_9PSEU|nr:type I restriction-modification system subunit M N-terminal domain-containing protein [Prauserella muralis]PXY21354.1 hypothetical protein BAY60_28375 [Prauserella muralis]TWE30484.1 HsdM-like protein [Prauserella muralis]